MLQNFEIRSHAHHVFIKKVLKLGCIYIFLLSFLFSLLKYHYEHMNMLTPGGETLTVILLFKCEIKYSHTHHTMWHV